MSETLRISVRISTTERDTLQNIANSLGVKFSDIIRASIGSYITGFQSWKTIFDAIHSRIRGSDGSQTLESQLDISKSDHKLN